MLLLLLLCLLWLAVISPTVTTHHVMTSIWIKIPHQNGNEMKGRKTISKKRNKNSDESVENVCCVVIMPITRRYTYFSRLLDASMFYVVPHCRSSHSHRIVRARVAFWLELLIYFDSILSLTKLTRQTTNSPESHEKSLLSFCYAELLLYSFCTVYAATTNEFLLLCM